MAKEELVLNDVVEVSVETAQEVLDGKWGDDWALGYALTVHSSQGLTIEDPQKVWIVDDYLQWSNLAYLAVSRVRYLHLLERCCPPPDADGPPPPAYDEAVARKNIGRKLQAYKRVDAKGHTCDNVRLACLECNRKRGAAALTHQPQLGNAGVSPGNVSAGQLQDLFDSI